MKSTLCFLIQKTQMPSQSFLESIWHKMFIKYKSVGLSQKSCVFMWAEREFCPDSWRCSFFFLSCIRFYSLSISQSYLSRVTLFSYDEYLSRNFIHLLFYLFACLNLIFLNQMDSVFRFFWGCTLFSPPFKVERYWFLFILFSAC